MDKIMSIEAKIWNFIDKHKIFIFLIVITFISIFLRISLYSNTFGDYEGFLEPWFNELKNGGGLFALNKNIGNYSAPYMTILALLTYLPISPQISIRTVSVVFDYVCASTLALIGLEIFKQNKYKKIISFSLYSATLFLPTVFLNSACWSQCDSIYTAFALISLLFLIKKKYILAFLFLGISFSFKLQFVFILPLYILVYISEREFSVLNFFILPFTNFVMCLPSIIFGNSLANCINVYLGQIGTYNEYITLNFPNFYGLFWGNEGGHLIDNPNILVPKIGIICVLFIYVAITFWTLCKNVKFDSRTIIEFALWSVLIATFFLPYIHERYLYMGDILALLYFVFNKDKYYITIGIEIVSLYGYLYFLLGSFSIDIRIVSALNFVIIILYSKDMLLRYFCNRISECSLNDMATKE